MTVKGSFNRFVTIRKDILLQVLFVFVEVTPPKPPKKVPLIVAPPTTPLDTLFPFSSNSYSTRSE